MSPSTKVRSRVIEVLLALAFSASLPAFASEAHEFNVPAEQAPAAVRDFASQAQVQILVADENVKDKQLHAVNGTYSTDQGLHILLADTGLAPQYVGDRSIALVSTAQATAASASDQQKKGKKSSSEGLRVARVDQGPSSSDASVTNEAQRAPDKFVLEEVVVTGSRLRRTDAAGPQDVKTYTREQIDQSGQTTVADFLYTLPDVSTAVGENGFQTNFGATTVTLHGLPIGTTLVLINGRRVTSSPAQGDSVFLDLNNIPLAAIERIEVLSAGSSAVYGSDAIAGVVNIILKKNIDDLEASVKYGGAAGTDETNAALLWGKHWGEGSFSLIGSYQSRSELEGLERGSVLRGVDPANAGSIDYSGFGRYTCHPGNVYFPNGYSFDGGQTTVPYAAVPAGYTGPPTVQEFVGTAGTLNSCPGHGSVNYRDVIPATQRLGIFGSGNIQVGSSAELFAELMYSHVQQKQKGGLIANLSGQPAAYFFTVPASNPYNPFGEDVGVSTFFPDAGAITDRFSSAFLRALIGARGGLLDSWQWEFAGWQSEERSHLVQVQPNFSALFSALSSTDPNTALNPFVDGPGGSEQLLDSLHSEDYRANYVGQTIAANGFVRGPLLHLPSGAVEAAIGVEYVLDKVTEVDINLPGVPPNTEASYSRDSYATFGEVRIPVVGKRAGPREGDILAVTAAGRYDHYSDFGGKTTPQFGVELRPVTSLLVRGTYGKVFKAPSLVSLYTPITTDQTLVSDPKHNNQAVLINVGSGGNPDLRPETGQSRTLGLAYSSEAIPDLHSSATYWHVEENNSVQNFDFLNILNNESSFPGNVVRDVNGNLVSVRGGYINFGQIDVEGFDYEASYARNTAFGRFTPSLSATQTYHYVTALIPGAPPVGSTSKAQDTGLFAPRWKGTVALGWMLGAFTGNVDGRYVGRYQDYDSNRQIGAFWLYDFYLRCDMGRMLTAGNSWSKGAYMTLGAVNLFNTLPQNSSYQFGTVGYDPTQSDVRGRFLYAQVGVKY